MANLENKKIAILLCTYNGSKFLVDQLESIAAQTHKNWCVIVSDDGSADETLNILEFYQQRWGKEKITVRSGPCLGFAANFLTLAADNSIKADFYAFCDQDDVWFPSKLEVALEYLCCLTELGIPNVYCGRTQYVSERLEPLGFSPNFTFPRSFRNALVQSIAGGNTMVFNGATKKLLEIAGVVDVIAHDWWVYLLVKAVNGKVYYDSEPQILYRQHQNALIGGNTSTFARFERVVWLILGRFRDWNDRNISALNKVRPLIYESNIDILDQFIRLRGSHLLHRFRMIEVCGLYRQSWRGTLSLYLAAFINKI